MSETNDSKKAGFIADAIDNGGEIGEAMDKPSSDDCGTPVMKANQTSQQLDPQNGDHGFADEDELIPSKSGSYRFLSRRGELNIESNSAADTIPRRLIQHPDDCIFGRDHLDAGESASRPDSVASLSHGSSEESFSRQWKSAGLEDAKDKTIAKLQEELAMMQKALKNKDETVSRLSDMQGTVDREIHELTASLFEEAHKMVTEANEKRVKAEKLLKEANEKVNFLQVQAASLKKLVLASTPQSSPGRPIGGLGVVDLVPSNWRYIPHRNVSVTPPPGSSKEDQDEARSIQKQLDFRDIDPGAHAEFVSWRSGSADWKEKDHAFLKRIYNQDILPCVSFANETLSSSVLSNIENDTIIMEQLDSEKLVIKDCALSRIPRYCTHTMKLDNSEESHYISQACRNRIAAICDFITFLRYISKGLITAGVHDTYWEIICFRKNMALARLGLGFVPANSLRSK